MEIYSQEHHSAAEIHQVERPRSLSAKAIEQTTKVVARDQWLTQWHSASCLDGTTPAEQGGQDGQVVVTSVRPHAWSWCVRQALVQNFLVVLREWSTP